MPSSAPPAPPAVVTDDADDARLLRYSRHLLLDEIGVEGQARIAAARALIIGAGGLGSPAALYLAAAGVGRLTLVDGDNVDLTNLQRQILHTTARIGEPKVASGLAALRGINPLVTVVPVAQRAAGAALEALVADSDVVLDCSDNFATRHALNRACVAHRVPLVSGAAIRFDGQLAVFDTRRADAPCYACLFPDAAGAGEAVDEPCSLMGVFAPLTGIVGTLQAAEALKLVAGIGLSMAGRLLLVDALSTEFRTLQVPRDPDCPVCGRR
jgi:molybdopterin-synthase adenylyltransferase